eukprot:3083236-Rhodomonas_salina.1
MQLHPARLQGSWTGTVPAGTLRCTAHMQPALHPNSTQPCARTTRPLLSRTPPNSFASLAVRCPLLRPAAVAQTAPEPLRA